MKDESSSLYVWQTGRHSWQTMHPASGLGAAAESRDQALADFERIWNRRSSYKVINSPPPMPRREGEPRVPEAQVEADERHRRGYAVYRELLKEFHPDAHAKRTFTAHEITRALIRFWEAVNG